MRLQLLLLHAAGMHSREELHPKSAVADVLLQLDVPARIETEKTVSLVLLNRDKKT